MIGRQHRFHGHTSLRYVYKHGQTMRGPLFSTKFAVNDRRKDFRVAVVVSKKVSKRAIVRNRIRRRFYELIRIRKSQIMKPYDIVITVYNEQLANMPAQELERLLVEQLVSASVFAKPHGIVNTNKERS
jgi:ribonuclease P protein component